LPQFGHSRRIAKRILLNRARTAQQPFGGDFSPYDPLCGDEVYNHSTLQTPVLSNVGATGYCAVSHQMMEATYSPTK
jgi:hypothetical protein